MLKRSEVHDLIFVRAAPLASNASTVNANDPPSFRDRGTMLSFLEGFIGYEDPTVLDVRIKGQRRNLYPLRERSPGRRPE